MVKLGSSFLEICQATDSVCFANQSEANFAPGDLILQTHDFNLSLLKFNHKRYPMKILWICS